MGGDFRAGFRARTYTLGEHSQSEGCHALRNSTDRPLFWGGLPAVPLRFVRRGDRQPGVSKKVKCETRCSTVEASRRVSFFALRTLSMLPSGLVGIKSFDQFQLPFVQQGPIDGTGAKVGHVLIPRQPVDGGLQ